MVVIASLCLSVGEGLRLRPFPTVAPLKTITAEVVAGATVSNEYAVRQYGPLDVPTPNQKRSKREALDLACAAIVNTYEVPNDVRTSAALPPFHVDSVVLFSRPPGRAPPAVS